MVDLQGASVLLEEDVSPLRSSGFNASSQHMPVGPVTRAFHPLPNHGLSWGERGVVTCL
jgi:hypothetical protein